MCLIMPTCLLCDLAAALPVPPCGECVTQTSDLPYWVSFWVAPPQWVCGSQPGKSEGALTRLWWKHSLITHPGADSERWHIRTKGIKISFSSARLVLRSWCVYSTVLLWSIVIFDAFITFQAKADQWRCFLIWTMNQHSWVSVLLVF